MSTGIIVDKGVNINPLWTNSIVIAQAPIAVAPTTPAAAAAAGGSLVDDTYYYKVTAIGVNGESAASAEVNATTSGTDNTVDLTWDAQTYVSEYRVYKGLATGDYDGYVTVATNSYSDTGADTLNTSSTTPPSSNNYTELQYSKINKDDIESVAPVFIPGTTGTDGVALQKSAFVSIRYNNCWETIDCEEVLNQSGWNTGTQAGVQQAVRDILSW